MSASVEREGWQAEAERVALGIRRRVLGHVLACGGGYLSQACSSAEVLAALYVRVLKLGPSLGPPMPPPFSGVPSARNPDPWRGGVYNGAREPGFDRFFFSPVHYALALYAALVEVGRMGSQALDQFNQDGSTVEMIGAEHSPGIESTAGSLGQTLSVAAGVAAGRRLKGENGRVFIFMSDGELQEGQTWEAVAAAVHHQLDRLVVVVDMNGQQCDGQMHGVMGMEPAGRKLRAFGAAVAEVDGHDIRALARAATRRHAGRPLVVLARTDPCRGVELLRERAPRLHYLRFKSPEERACYEALARSLSAPDGRR